MSDQDGQQPLEAKQENPAEYTDFDDPCDWPDQDARHELNAVLWACIGFGFGVVFGFVNPLGFGL